MKKCTKLMAGLLGIALPLGLAASSFAESRISVIPPTSCENYPIRLTNPGSYLLVGNLDMGKLHCEKSAITIETGFVYLDLNGFAILGNDPDCQVSSSRNHHGIDASVDCPSHAPPCAAGEEFDSDDNQCSRPCHIGVTVKNGSVTNMSDDGVHLRNDSIIDGVKAISNCGEGIQCGEGCLVENSLSNGNGGEGFEIDDAGTAISDVASGNGDAGFHCDSTKVSLVNDTSEGNSSAQSGCNDTGHNNFQ